MVCAVRAGCDDGDRALARAYGERDGALVRAHAPNLVYERGERQLPVDWRRCRERRCATAPDEPALDVHRGDGGAARDRVHAPPAARRADLHPVLALLPGLEHDLRRRRPGLGGELAAAEVRELVSGSGDWPGYHRDDWESVQVRLDPDGSAWVRASSHGHYQGCKHDDCRNRWVRRDRLVASVVREPRRSHPAAPRPSRLPGPPRADDDRRGLRLIPLETHQTRRYRRLDERRQAAVAQAGVPRPRERRVVKSAHASLRRSRRRAFTIQAGDHERMR